MESNDDSHKLVVDAWYREAGQDPEGLVRNFDLLDFPEVAPYAVILDVLSDPLDFQYRMIGTEIVEVLNKDLTGMKMSEILHQKPPSTIWSNCQRTVEERKPIAAQTPYVGPKSGYLRAEDLLLPIAKNSETIDTLIVLVRHILVE